MKMALARKEVLRQYPELEGDDLEQEVQDVLCRWEDEEEYEEASIGIPADAPTVITCDFDGTGEGQFHALIR